MSRTTTQHTSTKVDHGSITTQTCPWFLMGVTAFLVRQSTEVGRASTLVLDSWTGVLEKSMGLARYWAANSEWVRSATASRTAVRFGQDHYSIRQTLVDTKGPAEALLVVLLDVVNVGVVDLLTEVLLSLRSVSLVEGLQRDDINE